MDWRFFAKANIKLLTYQDVYKYICYIWYFLLDFINNIMGDSFMIFLCWNVLGEEFFIKENLNSKLNPQFAEYERSHCQFSLHTQILLLCELRGWDVPIRGYFLFLLWNYQTSSLLSQWAVLQEYGLCPSRGLVAPLHGLISRTDALYRIELIYPGTAHRIDVCLTA